MGKPEKPWNNKWPGEGMESLGNCPVCGTSSRLKLHEGLVDNVFYAAPGKWSLWRCAGCQAAYLDPRPNRETIHAAYSQYYTHEPVLQKPDYGSLSRLRQLRRRLVNGYTNWRFSTCQYPASQWGIPLLSLLWTQRIKLESEYRYLPRCPPDGGELLDIGCGNGHFLSTAKSCGWRVCGLDPDAKAVANARHKGLHVLQGGLEQFNGQENVFDIITLHHVIEHVHDPVTTLKNCYRLLKPGGCLWLETPNIDSLGHKHYARDWRGLEPPRHLVLFNQAALSLLVKKAGFDNLNWKTIPSPLTSMTNANEAIRQSLPVDSAITLGAVQKRWILRSNIRQLFSPTLREFLSLSAVKTHKQTSS